MDQRSPRNRLYTGLFFVGLFASWVAFSGLLDAFHLALGVVSCGIVTWLSADLLFDDRTQPLSWRIRQGWRLLGYVGWLLGQVVLANVFVFKLAIAGRRSLQPQIIRHRTTLQSDFEKFLFANSITLTPGTVTMKILGDDYFVHAIDDVSAAGLGGEMERRIARIFEPPGR